MNQYHLYAAVWFALSVYLFRTARDEERLVWILVFLVAACLDACIAAMNWQKAQDRRDAE